MPKLRNPLHSGAASGKLDEQTVFSTFQGRTYAKRHVVPKQPNTKAQVETYARMSWAMKLWQGWLGCHVIASDGQISRPSRITFLLSG